MLSRSFDEGFALIVRKIKELHRKVRVPTISISGASQSGKSFLTKQITEALLHEQIETIVLGMDSYYRTKQELIERGLAGDPLSPLFDLDHPSAVDLEQLAQDIGLLTSGQEIQ